MKKFPVAMSSRRGKVKEFEVVHKHLQSAPGGVYREVNTVEPPGNINL